MSDLTERAKHCMCKEPGAGNFHPNMTCLEAAQVDDLEERIGAGGIAILFARQALGDDE